MASRSGSAIAENDRRLIKDHAQYVREALFSCITQTQVECSVAFARYLSLAGLNSENYWLFLRLVMTNNPWVIDEMLHDREPRLLFSTIRPDSELIEAAFQTLFSRHPEELYPRALETLLGIIQNAYFDPDDGYRIRKLSIMDINALGKFLLKDQPQENAQNRLILEILDRITRLGEYYGEPDKSVLSKHAFNVRFAYFDRTREMVDAIPEPLLARVADRNGVSPEDDFADLVTKRRERKRDKSGRFVKENAEFIPETAGNTVASEKPAQPVITTSPPKASAAGLAGLKGEAPKPVEEASKPASSGSSKAKRPGGSQQPVGSKVGDKTAVRSGAKPGKASAANPNKGAATKPQPGKTKKR
ncbi:MAG TPA: hypothetical protein VMV83_00890 [Rectinemataceae bacterium]|nr:hypothetical protein [Rectinemataceae bacterium]